MFLFHLGGKERERESVVDVNNPRRGRGHAHAAIEFRHEIPGNKRIESVNSAARAD